MNAERFEILAEAYGGDLSRWPADTRQAAAKLLSTDPSWAGAVLARAQAVDDALAAFKAPGASAPLTEQILRSAPRGGLMRWAGRLLPAAMGAGLVAAGAAGVIAGVQLSGAAIQATDGDAMVSVIGDDDLGLELEEAAG